MWTMNALQSQTGLSPQQIKTLLAKYAFYIGADCGADSAMIHEKFLMLNDSRQYQ